MKKLAVLIVVPLFFVFIFFIMVGFIDPSIQLKYNDVTMDAKKFKPFIYSEGLTTGIVFSVDVAKELFHGSLLFSEDQSTCTLKVSTETLVFHAGSNKCIVNGREKDMKIAAIVKNGSFFVPIRFLAENCGKSVFWQSETSTVNIFDCMDKKLLLDNRAKEFISLDKVQIVDETLRFPVEGNAQTFYPLHEALDQKQLLGLTKKWIDHNYYLLVEYVAKNKTGAAGPAPFVNIGIFEKPSQNPEELPLLQFSFYGEKLINPKAIWKQKGFSNGAKIKLEINKLYYGDKPEDGWLDAYYENKLKVGLVELFGEGTGLEISEYLFDEYLNIRQDDQNQYNSYKKNRRFSGVAVDLAYGVYPNSKDTIFVYFSY